MADDRLERAWVHTSAAPLYVWRIPRSATTEELVESLCIIREWVSKLDHPYGWINDPRRLELQVIAVQRRVIAEHLRVVEPYSQRWCAGMSTIVQSSIIRGVAVAIGWLSPYPFPTALHSTFDEAQGWVCERLQARGSAAPSSRNQS